MAANGKMNKSPVFRSAQISLRMTSKGGFTRAVFDGKEAHLPRSRPSEVAGQGPGCPSEQSPLPFRHWLHVLGSRHPGSCVCVEAGWRRQRRCCCATAVNVSSHPLPHSSSPVSVQKRIDVRIRTSHRQPRRRRVHLAPVSACSGDAANHSAADIAVNPGLNLLSIPMPSQSSVHRPLRPLPVAL